MRNSSVAKVPVMLPYASLYTAQRNEEEKEKSNQEWHERLTLARQLVQTELQEMGKSKQNEGNGNVNFENDLNTKSQQIRENLNVDDDDAPTIDFVRQLQSVNVDMLDSVASAQSVNDSTNHKLQENADALHYENLISEFVSNAVLEEQLNEKKTATQKIQSLLEYMQRVQFDLVMAEREIREINAARYLEQRTFVEKLEQLHNEATVTQEKIIALEKILDVTNTE